MGDKNALFVDIASSLGGRVYEVGGCVRDQIMGLDPKDQDLLFTGIPYENLATALEKVGKVDLVGKSFGVLKTKIDGVVYDVTIPRKDTYYGHRHTNVVTKSDPNIPLEDDLARRDFTVNAIARDLLTGSLIDPFYGLEAIKNKRLDMVSLRSFEEDALRMLRGVQFAARFGMTLGLVTKNAMQNEAESVRYISAERVATELVKMFRAPVPSVGLDLMKDTGLLQIVLPEIHALIGIPQPRKYHVYDVYNHSKYAMDRIPWKKQVYLRVAALYHDVGKPRTYTNVDGEIHFYGHQQEGADMADDIFNRLRLHSVDGVYFPIDRVKQLIREHMFECNADSPDRVVRRFVHRLGGRSGVMDQLRLRIADQSAGHIDPLAKDTSRWIKLAKRARALLSKKTEVFGLKNLAVNGNDILALGLKPGPIFGKLLNQLLEVVLDDVEKNDKETLITLAKEFIEKGNECTSTPIKSSQPEPLTETSGEKIESPTVSSDSPVNPEK